VAPGVDRTSIAKALLLGKRGAEELQKKIKEVSVISAGKSQGIGINDTLAADLAARGVDYGTALTNFGTVAKGAPDLQKLTEISTGQAVKPVTAQESIIKSLFQQDVKEQERIRLEAEKEAARFSGASGLLGSQSLASRNRANRVI
jgi:phosphosulfolactate phosphohydrolase-like enzyme